MKKFRPLIAFTDEDYLNEFKIMSSRELDNHRSKNDYVYTHFEEFQDDILHDDYDCVIFVFSQKTTPNTIKEYKKYQDHYSNAPIMATLHPKFKT